MMAWLIGKLVKNSQDTENQQVRQAYGTWGSLIGLALNLLLSLMKIIMGILTGSVAFMADGVNNLSDAGGSLVSLVAVRMAQKPDDDDHPFGHGRIEYLGALAVGILIAFFGVELLTSGISAIFHPGGTAFTWLAVGLMGVGMAVKLWMWRFYRFLGTKTDNPTLLAAAKDSLSDVFATGAVALSAACALIFSWPIDGYMGVLVSLLVLKAAWEVLQDVITRLLGGKPDKEKGRRIVEKLLTYPGILGVHDLVLHDYGPGRSIASVHAEVSAESDFVAAHEVIDQAEREISKEMDIPICIHMDPILTRDEKTEKARSQMAEYLAALNPPLQLHDFRRVPGDKNINLVFDVALKPGMREISTLREGISAHARTLDPRYRCVIHFDRDYFSAVDPEESENG